MLVLELSAEVAGSLASFVVQVIRLIRICIRIWTIWTARQPASVGNGDQDDIPHAGNEEAEADADCELWTSALKVRGLSLRLYCNNQSAPLCNFINFYLSKIHELLSFLSARACAVYFEYFPLFIDNFFFLETQYFGHLSSFSHGIKQKKEWNVFLLLESVICIDFFRKKKRI